VNHPNEERGFGGGLGHNPQAGYDQSQQLGDGYNTGMATGADAYAQPQQRREGGVDKVKDSAGAGPNSGYNARTQTGNDAYVHGNHPVGMQDRVQGVNEPTMLGGEHGVNTGGVGRRDGGLGQGEHVPETMMGERRTEPGYDTSKGHHRKLRGPVVLLSLVTVTNGLCYMCFLLLEWKLFNQMYSKHERFLGYVWDVELERVVAFIFLCLYGC